MQANPKRSTRRLAGIVLVDKPQGFTSNQVLQRTKRLYRASKAGHTGTLDPLATGMLPICFGAATRVSGMMLESSKRYEVTARFGIATASGDAMGEVVDECAAPEIPADELALAVGRMVGPMDQVPPMYSAIKHKGTRLYKLAREGREVSREPRRIEVHDLRIVTYAWPSVTLSVHCSKGTYVRTLVTDLAKSLGTIGHVTALRRIAVGPFTSAGMVTLEALEAAAEEGLERLDRWLLGIDSALVDWPAVTVAGDQSEALRHGRTVKVTAAETACNVRIYDEAAGFLGTGSVSASGELRPTRIFNR